MITLAKEAVLKNSLDQLDHHREEPCTLNPDKNQWYESDLQKFNYRQRMRSEVRNFSTQQSPSVPLEMYQNFVKLAESCAESVVGYVTISGVPIEQFMIPITNPEHQIRAIAGLTRIMFGAYTDFIVYPKRRTSVDYKWEHTFAQIFQNLDVKPEDGISIITLCICDQSRIEKRVQNPPGALTTEEHRAFEKTWKYWCNDTFTNPATRAQIFYVVYYMASCSHKSYKSKDIMLSTDYGPEGLLGDIMDLVRDFCPLPKGVSSNLPCKTFTRLIFGSEPKATIKAGYGADDKEIVDREASSNIVECLNMNGAGAGDFLNLFREMIKQT